MKTIGLLTAWAAEKWILPCIDNALKYVDELRVCVAYHHPAMRDLADTTTYLVGSITDGRVTPYWHMDNDNERMMPDVAKCRILNTMLQDHEPGDVVMICDVDEFYDNQSIAAIRKFVASDADMGIVSARYFAVDAKHYVVNPDMPRLFRAVDDFCFIPTQQPRPVPKKPVVLDGDMYHYSLFTSHELRRRYWGFSPIGNPQQQQMKKDWLDNIYLKWDLGNEQAMLEKNKALTGRRGFWFHDDMLEPSGGGLFVFDGQHPPEVVPVLEREGLL